MKHLHINQGFNKWIFAWIGESINILEVVVILKKSSEKKCIMLANNQRCGGNFFYGYLNTVGIL